MAEMKVTPWEVEGDIDYKKLVEDFGLSLIDKRMSKELRKYMKDSHFIRRQIFFSHRDLDFILKEYKKGNKFYLYTGRGPSGNTHLGHLIPWLFTKELQEAFKAKLIFQLTDDEKFLFNDKLEIEDVQNFAKENMLDIIAVGFDYKKTTIYSDLNNADVLYKQAVRVAKKLTFSTTKAVFGFDNSTNVGKIFFTSMQAVPAFLESVKMKKNVPCLIPHAIDQDAHFRIARDILPKLGYYKPASIQCQFIPGLTGSGKMSASDPNATIYTTDDEKTIEKKIKRAFTGGQDSVEKQKELGGKPDICPVFKYYFFLFEKDDKELTKRFDICKGGKLMCGQCKKELIPRVQTFIKEHQEKRIRAKKVLNKFLVK